jgi:hypothetical protein
MLRRILLLVLAILIAVGVWTWVMTVKALDAQKTIQARFDDVVKYYVQMGNDYVQPLAALPELPEAEKAALEVIVNDLGTLDATRNIEARYGQLLAVQQKMMQMFGAGSGTSLLLSADPHFFDWNMNATSRGKASVVVLGYNQALSAYIQSRNNIVGNVVEQWSKWPFRDVLGTDGKTSGTSEVRF